MSNNLSENDIKYQNLGKYTRNILSKYYDNEILENTNFNIYNNILILININERIIFDRNITYTDNKKIYKNNNSLFKKNMNNKNNPKLLKLLSIYYDLNEISFEYNKNVCIIKKKNSLEYLYCDFPLISKKKFSYFDIEYENIRQFNELAILIQIGKWETFSKMLHYIDIIAKIECNYYITIVENEATQSNINLLKSKLNKSVILIVNNKGMDIGPFLINLLYLKINNIKPKYIIKIHTKTDDRFREHVLNHLIGSENIISNNLLKLKNNINLGMLTGTLIFNTINNNSFFDNHIYYLDYLSQILLFENLERFKLEFAIGTFFYSKYEIFDIFNEINIKFIYNKLNDENTLDINWYSIFYNLNTHNVNKIEKHYEENLEKNFKNNLDFQKKTNCSGMRDFMIEHALERFFGYLCKKYNYNMIEV